MFSNYLESEKQMEIIIINNEFQANLEKYFSPKIAKIIYAHFSAFM